MSPNCGYCPGVRRQRERVEERLELLLNPVLVSQVAVASTGVISF